MWKHIHVREKYINTAAFLLIAVFTIAGVLVSIHRYWQYEVFFYDFGIFDQAIWKVSRFQAPIIDHLTIGGKLIFADHFSPSIFLLAPLYWITNRSEMLLITQAFIVGMSGLVLYKIGRKILRNSFLAFCILVSYFLFIGLQNAVISDFHELTVMTLPLMLTFWALVNKKPFYYIIFLLITLGFKEVTFFMGVGIGILIFFIAKDWFKIALFTIVVSIVWGVVSIKIIIPYFSQGSYSYFPTFASGLGVNIGGFVDHPLKRATLFYSFFSFGFLPLMSPEYWFLIIQDYALRFLSSNCCTRWVLGLHYNAQSAVILAVASTYAFARLEKNKLISKHVSFLGILFLLNALFLYRFILHGPFALAYNPDFYKHTKDFRFLNELVEKIPKNATIMTQNNLAVRFTHQKVWLLRYNYVSYNPDYILVDIRSGQNQNNFFGSDDVIKIVTRLKKDPNYSIFYKTAEQFIFKKQRIQVKK